MNIDVALFRLINIAGGADFLAPFMTFMSTLKYFLPAIIAIVAWMLFKDGKRGKVTVLALLLLIPATDQLSSHVVKPLVARPRPCRPEAAIEGVKIRAHCSGKGSFPSSHATNMGGVAFLLGWRYRRAAWVAALFAFLVGYSRIYLGVHYPLDVVGGWSLGCLVGGVGVAFAAWVQRRWEQRATGRVR